MTEAIARPQTPSPDWMRLRANTLAIAGNRLYADWTASGRLYRPIERRLLDIAGPMMANTHTEDSLTGQFMTRALDEAHQIMRHHVNASSDDVVLFAGTGMTGALAKLVRMLGLWVHESHRESVLATLTHRPRVYVTHMEHHSNHTLWLETLAEVVIIPPTPRGEVDLNWLAESLRQLPDGQPVMASVTAASNVTGVSAPYRAIARLVHQAGGHCFVDFACAAPYVDIDMHPVDDEPLDAVFFSPHKFLGGPGASGVLVFNASLYQNRVPEQPGGGTVVWTNPWGEHRFIQDIATRESGGTPGILQSLKAAMAAQLKDEIGVQAIRQRESVLNEYFLQGLDRIAGIQCLARDQADRLSVFSVVIEGLHYQQAVQRLSHEYGIEARGGCACAGTYGHYLLGIDRETSQAITGQLDRGELAAKPGWVRLSFHPMMTTEDLDRILAALAALASGATSSGSSEPVETDLLWGNWIG
ncbi:aminotransferase class V-fold PLP-dependent enzyme [Saccharospirillum impatiens]|uniref:aminotransferase class V-fold PLP-dependent enzyme n=1 Tax=Saccharospirillum impatiens TaxID=169438 RepID=UPI0003F9534A|nr:aminotransferase class V-fold PLP-dependent enzyme [Saccharospirillum impatiens]